ncbi:MAG TPA: hypothetical protein VMZ53_25120, partial [Kofleriaceae bacterium]|nr:hypothetical protein [Kofleriaceae bacterium]
KALFELYDAFGSASLDTTLWTNVRGSTLNNGRLVVGGGGQTDNGVISKMSFGVNNAVDFIIVASQATTAMPGFWAGFEGSTTDGPPYTIWWTLDTSNMIAPSYKITTASTDYRGTPFAFTTAAHYYSVEHYGKGTMYRYDDVPYDTQAYDVAYTSPLFIRLWNYNSSPSVAYDMVRVRQAVDPPPAVVVGAPVAKP